MAWKTGYYYGSGFGGASVPYSQYTHVLYESISPNGGGGIDTSPANLSELDTFVANAHAAGTKALVCLGVADSGAWQGSTSGGNIDSFVSAVHSFVTAHNLDGVDLDWESGIIDSQYASFIQKLRASFGSGLTISMAAYGGGTGNPKHAAVLAGPSNLDQINMMTYDMDIYEGQTWFETAVLKGPDNRTSIQTAFEEFTSSGIPASKLGIGIPFYGSKYNSASGINQSRSYGGFIAYSNINPSGAVVNGTYQGTGVGSNPWITFAGAAEIADIVAYGSSVGAGGFMTFPINWEDNANTLSGALSAALGGGASPTLPTIYSFSSDTTTVVSGGPVTFTYSTANATSLSINGTTVTGTSHTFNPTSGADYVLTATNTDGSTLSSVIHISIGSGAPTISSFTASPATFVSGQSVTLAWQQQLGTSASINNGVGSVTGLSSKVVVPSGTTSYTLTVANGTLPDATATTTATLGTAASAAPVISSFTASSTSVSAGTSVTLSVGVAGAAPSDVTINGVLVAGTTVTVAPRTTTTYFLVASNSSGTSTASITIQVVGPSPNNVRYWQIRRADRHGIKKQVQMSDGTGILRHLAGFNGDGSLTDSGVDAAFISGIQPYHVVFYLPGPLTAGVAEPVMQWTCPSDLVSGVSFASAFGGFAKGYLQDNPASTATCNIYRVAAGSTAGTLGTLIGSIVISTSGAFTFSLTAESFVAGDSMTVWPPSPADSTLAGVGWTLPGMRGPTSSVGTGGGTGGTGGGTGDGSAITVNGTATIEINGVGVSFDDTVLVNGA